MSGTPTSTATEAVEIFCSYAHKDEAWRRKLDTHLEQLQQQGLISVWHDRQIVPGTDWAQTIDDHLDSASLILLLISPAFMDSQYCMGIEVERALQRQRADEAFVIPILLHQTPSWDTTPFAYLQALPTGAQPVTTWDNEEAAFVDITAGIRRSLEEISLLAASLPRTRLPNIWNVPFAPNAFFLGREEPLERLYAQLQANQATAVSQPQAISGLGGIGKTQLVVEYAYRYHHHYQAVLWVQAETRESLISSYGSLAQVLNLPLKNEQEQDRVVQAVKAWLQQHSNWLLILDNANEPELLPPFLPTQAGGYVLLTTRSVAVGSLGIANPLILETFSAEQGALLLLRRANRLAPAALLEHPLTREQEIAVQLSQELGGLPLALDQAGAYLEANSDSLADYWSLYKQHRAKLLTERRSLTSTHPEAVATTWNISFQRVQECDPAAAELLRFCAFLAPDAIPQEILIKGAAELGSILASAVTDNYRLNQAIEVLRTYSLIARNSQARTLSIHRLVQAVIQDAMIPSEWAQWHKRAIQTLDAVFPDVTLTVWPQCERLLPHVLVAANSSSGETGSLELARCLRKAATYFIGRARYREAEPLLQHARQITEQQLDPDPIELTLLLNGLAMLFIRQGEYPQAEPFLQQALQIIENQLDSDHFLEGITLSNLGLVYLQQGRYAQAEPLFQQALQIIENQSYSDHSLETLLLGNLGLAYFYQEKYIEAEPLLQRAMQNLDHMEEFVHHDLVLSLGNLGLMYFQQHKYAEAESVSERALQISEQQLGSDHPNVALLLANLAQLYIRQDKYSEAEPLLQRSLQICEQQPDSEPTYVVATLLSLADLYYQQDKYTEAEPLLQRALQICDQRLGSDHPLVATVLSNLGDVYRKQGKYAEAESLLQRALQIREQRFGLEHPQVAGVLIDQANLYKAQQKYAQAESLYQQALQIREQWFGIDHLNVADALIDLANLYKAQQKYDQAEPLLQRALQIREQQLGLEHPDVADVLYNLANLYYQQNKYAKAEPLFQRALQIREQRLGPDHLKVASSLTGLALLYEARLKLAKAKQLYQRALHIREQQLGPDHLEVATTLYNLATLYRSPGKYAEPEPLFQRALQIREQQLGSEHPSTREVREAYESYLKAVRYGYLIGLTLPILISIICLIFWFFHKFDLLSWIALALAIIAARGPFLVGYYILVDRYKKPPSSAT